MLTKILKKAASILTPVILRQEIAVTTPLGFRFVLVPDDLKSVKMASGFLKGKMCVFIRPCALSRA
jgi:hypothetical protein